MSSGLFPETMIITRVVPVYKKGDTSFPASCRPVGPIIANVLESIMHSQLYNYVDGLGVFSESQFRRGRSTLGAVLTLQ